MESFLLYLNQHWVVLKDFSLDIRFKPEAKPIVVPIRKSPLPGQAKPSIRVCGDYSVTVNSQLEDHRQPIPLPEDLMRKLGCGYCFSKIDLANAYNQICLSPDSQKKEFYFRKDFLSELNPHQGISKKSWNS